ncbi:MAG: hypothetical protein Q4P26_06510 [Lachnospiraceae bacterium]|nr:hypothetical protein [Lachnospiraceae bacterium]
MQRTKLGVSVGLVAAAMYFMGVFSGYLLVALLAVYVLLYEENGWLKQAAVRAVAILVAFSFCITVVKLVPDVMDFIDDIAALFGGNFRIVILSNIVSAITSALNLIEKLLLLVLGIKALKQESISVPIIDNLLNKYM